MAISDSECRRKTSGDASIKTTVEAAGSPADNTSRRNNDNNDSKMDYDWMQPKHDPIVTDTNLAEIDFEEFRNEDLAYAFSCGDEESGASSTDMSICRSEALFSSMRDSSAGAIQDVTAPPELDSSLLIQDSLSDVDLNLARGNKNHYQLTYSSHANVVSGIMMTSSSGAAAAGEDRARDASVDEINNRLMDAKLTTWSNLGSKQRSKSYNQDEKMTSREENKLNNNNSGGNTTASTNTADGSPGKSKSLPEFARQPKQKDNRYDIQTTPTESKLVTNFMKNRGVGEPDALRHLEFEAEPKVDGASALGTGQIPMMRSKDTVNQFLKAAAAAAANNSAGNILTSIEERTESSSNASSPAEQKVKKDLKMTSNDESKSKNKYPDLNFLENDIGLWDAFFLHSKNAAKHHSVLGPPPPLPVEEYMREQMSQKKHSHIQDSDSLRVLLPQSQQHLLPQSIPCQTNARMTPITQVCQSLSQLKNTATTKRHVTQQEEKDKQNEAIKNMFTKHRGNDEEIQMVKVKEAWTEVPEKETVVLREKKKHAEKEQNVLNNNDDADQGLKRRSCHNPQDQMFRLFEPSGKPSTRRKRPSDFPKSGSQNDLCDARTPEDELGSPAPGGQGRLGRPANKAQMYVKTSSAEYPVYSNLYLPPQGINFDLTHKRALFVNLYSSVERLLMYADGGTPDTPGLGPEHHSVRYLLFHEICPALHAIMTDGMKPEVITSFGRMATSPWRLVEAVTRQGSAAAAASTTAICDLVMMINMKFDANGEDERKFAGFVAGMLNMSCLHIWFSKLKWSMDVLLRFYERHAFMCALHKETKLLFDELLFCLQRLYSIPFKVEMPFSNELLDNVPSALYYRDKMQHPATCPSCRTSFIDENSEMASPSQASKAPPSTYSGSRRGSKSRIPRPISLPKRLEAKLGASPSPVRSKRISSKASTGESSEASSTTTTATAGTGQQRKSRVRDTVKLFDSRSSSRSSQTTTISTNNPVRASHNITLKRPPSSKRKAMASPSGAGEAIASGLDSSGK